MTELVLGALGALLLHVFFRAVEVRWPESYYGLSDFTSYQISMRLSSYLTFRFLPVLVMSSIVSAIATSAGWRGQVAGLAVALIHGAWTAGRGAWNAFRQDGVFARRLLLAAHLGVLTAVVVAGWIGAVLGSTDAVMELVPEPVELRGNLWTAILAGVFGAYLARVTQGSGVEPSELIRESSRRLGPEIIARAEEAADRHGADPELVKAILIVENLQRPRWIRSIERVAGRALPIGTYGVMQVRSDQPISDEESIEVAVSTRLAGRRVPMSTWTSGGRTYLTPDSEGLQRLIRSYNGNERFIELVEAVYYELRG